MCFAFLRVLFFVFSAGLLAVSSAKGQVYGMASLEGTVVDEQTQQPVIGALISVEAIIDGQLQQQQKIGPTGAFRFVLDPKKNYYIRTEANGYRPTQEKLIFTSAYATRLYGKMILLKKGGPSTTSLMVPAAPTASVTSSTPATATVNSIAPAPAIQSAPVLTTAPASVTGRTGPAITSVSAATAHALPKPAPPASVTAQTRSATPAPPLTVSAVQMQLRAVQFVQSKAELTPDSQPALDQLLTFMQQNPNVSIELAGHTDNQGNFEENLALSRQRVELVKAFLVQHGIVASRISSRGYGSTRPIASNNSEATRRLNRRVEMAILPK